MSSSMPAMSDLLCVLTIVLVGAAFGVMATSLLTGQGGSRPWRAWAWDCLVGGLIGTVVFGVIHAAGDLRSLGFFAVVVPLVLGAVHLWTHVAALHASDEAWPDDPCVDTGTWLGGHWFAFESLPGRQLWTRDDARAHAVRGRAPPALEGALDVKLPGGHDSFHQSQALAMGSALLGGLLASLTGIVVGWTLAASLASHATGWFETVATGVGITAILLLPLHLGMALLLAGAAWFLSNRVLRPHRPDLVWQGGVLFVDGRAFHLDDPGLEAELTWNGHGAVLTLATPTASVRVPGRHRDLAALEQAIVGRERSSAREQDRAREALRAVRERP